MLKDVTLMKKEVKFITAGFLVMISQFFGTAMAQESTEIVDSIYSDVMKESRVIQVYLPQSYKPGSGDRYDVIYVLDGEWTTKLAAFLHAFARHEGYTPPAVIVGIPNKYKPEGSQRSRDFKPYPDGRPFSGKADDFLSFLKQELIPYINKTYPSNGRNTLWGHSNGGIFTLYTFLTSPQIFETYIATDPAWHWENGWLNKLAKEKLATAGTNKTFWMAGREGNMYQEMGIAAVDSTFQAEAPANLRWKSVAYPNETHDGVRLKAFYDALKFIYSDYTKSLRFHPMNGIILKDRPAKVWILSNFPEDIRYTTDGTEPSISSPRTGSELMLMSPAILNTKLFTHGGRFDKKASGQFILGKTLPAVALPGKAKQGGWNYYYYEGKWDKMPDFKSLKPLQSGLTDRNFNLSKYPEYNFSILMEGYIDIKEEGYYLFLLDTDAGDSKLYLGNQLLIDYDALKTEGRELSFMVPLAKGFYPIRLEYLQKQGNRNLWFAYIPPGKQVAVSIPVEQQYHMVAP